jgi:putative ATP-dependent endonuclease of OLD family
MQIQRVLVENYRSLRKAEIHFGDSVNIVVGNNEVGKSTLIEAINLALRHQINRRSVHQELHPYLLNIDAVREFIASHKAGNPCVPPKALIEVFLKNTPEVAHLRGTNNSRREDACGISLTLQLDEERFLSEYEEYVSNPALLNSVPMEYYEVVSQTFAGQTVTHRDVPITVALIDASAVGNIPAAQRYVLEVIKDYLSKDRAAQLAKAYRGMREAFQKDDRIAEINSELALKKNIVSERSLTVALDTTSRSTWEVGVLPHLDDIPMTLVGRGEQNSVKIKLAIEASTNSKLILIEEPETHLSHTSLGKLVNHIAARCSGKQVIITTHSNFVMNRLGVEHVIMFDGKRGVSLGNLPTDTQLFFRRLPGHDTLRMVLAKRTILVEGPSDELIVQKAYRQRYKKLPLEMGHEVISVGTSFKRFLDIAILLNLSVAVVADNDAIYTSKMKLYKDYLGHKNLKICIDSNDELSTLEPQLVRANGVEKVNRAIGKSFTYEKDLVEYMTANKTDVALRLFESPDDIVIPSYIEDALL